MNWSCEMPETNLRTRMNSLSRSQRLHLALVNKQCSWIIFPVTTTSTSTPNYAPSNLCLLSGHISQIYIDQFNDNICLRFISVISQPQFIHMVYATDTRPLAQRLSRVNTTTGSLEDRKRSCDMSGSFRLGKIRGIDLYVNLSWLIILV